MSHNRRNKVILVTGASKRLGLAIARYLHDQDYNLMLHYRTETPELKQAITELNAIQKGSVSSLSLNLNSENADVLISETIQRYGRLDVLINNASSFYSTPIGDISTSAYEDLMNSNLKVPIFLSQSAAPYLKEVQGSIINIIDIYHDRPMPQFSVYTAAKAGLANLTKSFALELAPDIRVNGIAPGAILWPTGESNEHKNEILKKIPLQRIGHPSDIAKAVHFVSISPYLTGQIIEIDGGRSLQM